jgi:hypothetical protein
VAQVVLVEVLVLLIQDKAVTDTHQVRQEELVDQELFVLKHLHNHLVFTVLVFGIWKLFIRMLKPASGLNLTLHF